MPSPNDFLNSLPGSVTSTGSPKDAPVSGEAQETVNLDDYVSRDVYEQLERKLGEQGMKLGELDGFYREVYPFLKKVEDLPGVVEAIMEGKIDTTLVQAISEGTVTIGEAKAVTKAAVAEVKKDAGTNYESMTPEDIDKLVEAKVSERIKAVTEQTELVSQKIDIGLADAEEKREFEKEFNSFVANTADFEDYAEDVVLWLDDPAHSNQYDIRTAYFAVKGMRAAYDAVQNREVKLAESAKGVAANAGGGGSMGQLPQKDPSLIDRLVGGNVSPNKWLGR